MIKQHTAAYKNLIEMQRAAHATLDGSADGLTVIEAMFVGQSCRRFGNEIGRLVDGPHRSRNQDRD